MAKKWKVIKSFADKKDGGYTYQVGEQYPRTGGVTDTDRIEELSSYVNRTGEPLIVEDSSGDSSLPDVTTDDNGDVLTVVEGAWDKAEPSGGSQLPIEVYEVYTEDYEAYNLANEVTYTQIKNAATSEGKLCFLRVRFPDAPIYDGTLYTYRGYFDGNPNFIRFEYQSVEISNNISSLVCRRIDIYADGTVIYNEEAGGNIPPV